MIITSNLLQKCNATNSDIQKFEQLWPYGFTLDLDKFLIGSRAGINMFCLSDLLPDVVLFAYQTENNRLTKIYNGAFDDTSFYYQNKITEIIIEFNNTLESFDNNSNISEFDESLRKYHELVEMYHRDYYADASDIKNMHLKSLCRIFVNALNKHGKSSPT